MKSKRLFYLSILTVVFLLVSSTAFAGITAVQDWSPRGAIKFKTAASCQFNGYFERTDVYAVFAVFTVRQQDLTLKDELWYLTVGGSSSSTTYGKITSRQRLAVEEVISHVDCTSDGGKKAYVVWDRSDDPLDTDNAYWTCVDILGGWTGYNEVPSVGGGGSFGCGIAYHGGALAISACGRGRCQYRSFVWPDVTDPATYVEAIFWYDGQSPKASDIIWNGEDSFLMAHLCDWDSGDCFIAMVSLLPDGTYTGFTLLGDPSWTDSDYKDIYLVYSDNPINKHNRVIIQTDRVTFWTDQWGNPIGSPVFFGPLPSYPACEYWGREKASIANFYSHNKRRTIHAEWFYNPLPAVNIYRLRELFLGPVACCSSDTFRDAEVLLIRRSFIKLKKHKIFFNFERQD
ncbi:MAG: hypothetical protein JXB23_01955 [Candidatus Aminicenantes bacterium]|nr:hypothetical protein [Candidatus Aminicenantes bacterium]